MTKEINQEKDEPVAYFDPQKNGFYWARPTKVEAPITVDVEPLPLYTTPQLKQEQGEPVAYVNDQYSRDGYNDEISKLLPVGTYLYTAPQQRAWVGLTDEDEIDWEEGGNLKDLVKAIEAKLKEKNT